MKRQPTKKNYHEPQSFECSWEVASSFILKGYRIVELKKRGGQVYTTLVKEEK